MDDSVKIIMEEVWFSYQHDQWILKNISAQFLQNSITAIIGPSGVGKSTILTIMNRLWEDMPMASMKGRVSIRFDGRFCDIYYGPLPLPQLRRLVGMVFQVPNPLPMSIYKNIAFPMKLAGYNDKNLIREKVEQALKRSYLWEEVKDRLADSALSLSGGQQQRLCIARALVMEPQVLLLDEPTSSLDAKASSMIEGLLLELKERCTLIVVSHYLDQVKRIADKIVQFSNEGLITY